MRWEDPERGTVAARRVHPVAEETGLIEPLGDWVLERALPAARALGRARASTAASPSTSRRASCAAPTSPSGSCDASSAHGIDPGSSCVELTETARHERRRRVRAAARRAARGRPARRDRRLRRRAYSVAGGCRGCRSQWLKLDRAFRPRRAGDPAAAAAALVDPRARGRRSGWRRSPRGSRPGAARVRPAHLRRPLAQGFQLGRAGPPAPPSARAAAGGLAHGDRLSGRAGTLSPSWRSPTTSAASCPCVVQDWSTGEVLTLAYMNAEALAAHARDRRAAPVEPLARRAVAQGRDVAATRSGARAAPRLRRRRAARARRARRARPATPASAPASTAASSSRAAPHEALPALERTLAERAARAPGGLLHRRAARRPAADRREGDGGGRGGRARRARGERRARRRGGRRRPLPPARAAAQRAAARSPTPSGCSMAVAAERDARRRAARSTRSRELAREHNLSRCATRSSTTARRRSRRS